MNETTNGQTFYTPTTNSGEWDFGPATPNGETRSTEWHHDSLGIVFVTFSREEAHESHPGRRQGEQWTQNQILVRQVPGNPARRKALARMVEGLQTDIADMFMGNGYDDACAFFNLPELVATEGGAA